ncbi:hypothetical protein MTR67_004803 [Solanum verrucosum]|uniref:SWIM-type domain-containing protein n=1 Tax=Solanum verrucosum TaxID=315347 RepID=A0AAF0PV94_SOLVR|nr:hypothetical protein MTR67_004803 [Solanum verrucosum]
MDCTIEFNGAAGFEVKEGFCQHKVDIARRTCSCRVWQLRGIPCAHVMAALYFKKFSLYRASFPACGLPVLSEALPVTQHGRRGRNCTLSCSEHCPSEWAAPTKQSFLEEAGLVPFRRPPFIYLDVEVRQAPGKSSKETYLRIYANVIEPLTNMEMWPVSTNPTIEPPEITNMLGRPPKARRKEAGETKKSGKLPRTGLAMTCNICHVRGHNKRGCPQRKGVESSTRQSAPSPTASVRAEPTGSGRERGKPKKTPSAPSGVGTTKRGRGRGRGNTSPEKRPRVMGMGVFQAANGFKVMNPGMPSSKIYSIGQAKVTRSSDVISDIGYTPSNTTKLKWNGKAAFSTSKLHELREKPRKKIMGSVLTYVVLVMCFTNGVVLSMLKYEWMTRVTKNKLITHPTVCKICNQALRAVLDELHEAVKFDQRT